MLTLGTAFMYPVNLKCCERVFTRIHLTLRGRLWEIPVDLKDGEPLEVNKFDNDTMLNFGYVLLKGKTAFSFPKTKNIKETKPLNEINNKQNSNQQ
jgi:hypothetical protein